MKQKSVKWNAVLNVIRMSLSILFPLITFPYASRVLGAETLGTINYTLTFTNYAALIAALGISNYAAREGAKVRDDKAQITFFTRQIFTINILTTLVAYAVLAVVVWLTPNIQRYTLLISIQSLSIIFTTLSVEWMNVIYEDYLYTTIRGVVTNLITLVLLFVFVKSPDDFYIYAGLTVVSHAVISVSNYFHCRKYVRIGITKDIRLKKHIVPVLVFFANSLAVSIYVNSDSTMLGWMVGTVNVGLYTAAVKVYSMVKTVLAAMYGVTISRMTFYISNGNHDGYLKLCRKAINGLITVLLPGAFALILFAKDIILILSGNEYIEAANALRILSIGLIFAIFGGFITTCVNIPNGREKINMIAAFSGAAINILLNLFMIPKFHQNGAAFTTVIAEALVFVICMLKSWDMIKEIIDRSLCRPFIDGAVGIAIITVSFLATKSLSNIFAHFALNVGLSVIGYGIYLLLSGNSLLSSYTGSIKKMRNRR